VGYNTDANRAFADKLLERVQQVRGTVDLHVQQLSISRTYISMSIGPKRSKSVLHSATLPIICWFH